jgi:hypothetical protein
MLAISTSFSELPLAQFTELHHPPRRGSLPKTPQNLDENARVPSRVVKGESRRLCGGQPYGSLGEGWKPHSHRTSPFGALFGGMACLMETGRVVSDEGLVVVRLGWWRRGRPQELRVDIRNLHGIFC